MTAEIPADKAALLEEVAAALRSIPNIVALALGGSHARGTHRPNSDLDIGIYYREAAPFRIDDVRAIAQRFAASEPVVTDFYEWGPFVNGGAWIPNAVCKIDFLYRNLDQLERAISAAQVGKWEHSFDQQPPFGYRSVITLGEIACCRPLYDPSGVLASLKSGVAIYPPAMKQRIVQDTLWAAEFSFFFASDSARAGDVPNTVGCMTRIFHYLVQALFALNETYFISDKRVLQEIARFERCPGDFVEQINAILGHPGHMADALGESLGKLQILFYETALLAENLYIPRFRSPQTDQH